MADQGLIKFIKQKLEMRIPLEKISASLLKAGFTEKQIADGIKEVKRVYRDTHQDIVAANDFLPPLKKGNKKAPLSSVLKSSKSIKEDTIASKEKTTLYHQSHGGQLFDGRIRRSDFILGFLFFFGLGIVVITAIISILYTFIPQVYQSGLQFVSTNTDGRWLILLPVVLTPITLLILSLASRRLHDIDLPGSLSLVLLSFFIPSTTLFHPYEIFGLYTVGIILFILMITKKGVKTTNRYGAPLAQTGSFFTRILTIN